MFAPFRLRATLGRTYNADLEDTRRAKQVLARLGHYETPGYGIDEYPDEPLFQGIESFQERHGLRRDGIMKPDGETATKLGEVLAEKDRQSTGPDVKPKLPLDAGSRMTEKNRLPSNPISPTFPPIAKTRPVDKSAGVGLEHTAKIERTEPFPDQQTAFVPAAVPFAVWLMPILGAATAAAAMAIYYQLSNSRQTELRKAYEKDRESDETCYHRWQSERDRCNRRAPMWIGGCKDRAADRYRLCVDNGGTPHPDEPPEWSRNDEQVGPPR